MALSPLAIWHPVWFLSTFFGVGKLPIAPGTWGSLCAFPIAFAAFFFLGSEGYIVITLLILAFLIAGTWAADVYAEASGVHDAGEIVIDEVVGQLIVLLAAAPVIGSFNHGGWVGYGMLLSCFLLFRLFDIIKPWPIGWIDAHVKGGLGIMLDDIVAALFAALVFYLGYLTYTNLFS